MNRPTRPPLFELLESRQLLSAGDLDTTFGSGGKVLTDLGLYTANAVAIQADGKLVLAADSNDHNTFDVVRFNADGTVDTTFGTGGIASHDLGAGMDTASAITVLPDGRILAAGRSQSHNSSVVICYNADGSLDQTFGDGGIAFAEGLNALGGVKMAVQNDGQIVLAVGISSEGEQDMGVLRMTADGQIDTTFGDQGINVQDLGGVDSPEDIVLQADGKIVVSAMRYLVPGGDGTGMENRGDFTLRFNTDGSLDSSFGNAGIVSEDLGGKQGGAGEVAIGMDGKIVSLGYTLDDARHLSLFLVRYNTDGSKDLSFGDNGRTVLNNGETGFSNLLIQPDGKILLAGSVVQAGYEPGQGPSDIAARRFNADGTVDSDYGDGGLVRVQIEGNTDMGLATALQQDGKLVIAGTTFHAEYGQDLSMIRLEGDAGAAGSRHATLRRGIDQQAEYLGKNKAAAKLPRHHHRSPKQRARELAAQLVATAKRTVAKPLPAKHKVVDDESMATMLHALFNTNS